MRLHETTRRWVCRATFVALGLVPLVVAVSGSVMRLLPSTRAGEIAHLEALTGWRIRVESIEYPRPGAWLVRGLVAQERETNRPVLVCRTLEAAWGQGKLVLKAAQAEAQAERSAVLWQLVDRYLRQAGAVRDVHVYLSSGELTWHSPSGAQSWVDLHARLGPTALGVEADVRFRLPGQVSAEETSLRLERRRHEDRVATHVELHTGGAALGVDAFRPLCDAKDWFGPAAQLSGHVALDEQDGRWSGKLVGVLSDVDLDRLVSARFPHALSGRAQIVVREAIVVDNRLVQLDAALSCGGGTISRSLVEAARDHLQLELAASLAPTATTIPFTELGLSLVADGRGLHIEGTCAGAPGAWLVGASGVVGATSRVEWRPITQLIRTLVPANEVQVPASAETDALIRMLPIPALVAPHTPSGDAPTPQVHVSVGGKTTR